MFVVCVGFMLSKSCVVSTLAVAVAVAVGVGVGVDVAVAVGVGSSKPNPCKRSWTYFWVSGISLCVFVRSVFFQWQSAMSEWLTGDRDSSLLACPFSIASSVWWIGCALTVDTASSDTTRTESHDALGINCGILYGFKRILWWSGCLKRGTSLPIWNR